MHGQIMLPKEKNIKEAVVGVGPAVTLDILYN